MEEEEVGEGDEGEERVEARRCLAVLRSGEVEDDEDFVAAAPIMTTKTV